MRSGLSALRFVQPHNIVPETSRFPKRLNHVATRLLLLAVLLLSFDASGLTSEKPKGDVEIYVVIPQYGSAFGHNIQRRTLWIGGPKTELGREPPFSVVFKNCSNRPLEFFTDSSSWGDRTVSFTLTEPNGKTRTARRMAVSYGPRNFPSVVRLEPGEVCERSIAYDSSLWDGFVEPADPKARMVKIRAELHQSDGGIKDDPDLWTGEAKSTSIEVEFAPR